MGKFDEKKAILRLLNANKKGVPKEDIIEYLDYLNKVRYSASEIDIVMTELEEQKKIKIENQLYFLIP